jgi:hypothetical protein
VTPSLFQFFLLCLLWRPRLLYLLYGRSVLSVSAVAVGAELADDGNDYPHSSAGDLPPFLFPCPLPYPLPSVTFTYPGG